MRLYILLTITLLAISAVALADNLPTCYYTYDQITQILADHQTQHPDIAKRVQIGVSQQDQIPIYAMRISDNVNTDEEEPALLFLGQVHAEEVLGVQITMSNIQEILANRYQLPYSQWINQLDVWFVPTLNPEGHNVVTSNMDISYRKNKRDNNNNGIFDFNPLTGYDFDGVDINRNMSFNWVHGDSLGQPGGLEVWDYYRGPAPMSESEVTALQNLCDQYKFVYSIVWHSSRTGNLSEKGYYPFNWKEVRPSPDVNFSASICSGITSQITTEAGGATYQSLPNLSRKGATHDWMYQQYGTFQILVECGTRYIQPDSLLMVNTVNRCSNGTRWLLNRALPLSSAVPSSSMLTGNIRDAITNAPLEAEIIVDELHREWFRPRTSKPNTGRYFKALPTGSYTIRIRKRGYWDTVVPNVVVNNSSWTIRNFTLQPRQPVTFVGSVRSGNIPLNATIKLYEDHPVSIPVDGNYIYQTFEGEYHVEVFAEGYYPYIGTITFAPGTGEHHFQLSPANVVFAESWESGTDGWEINGPWVLQNELSADGHALTDSWGGNGFYEMNCDVWVRPTEPIAIPSIGSPILTFESHVYVEWDNYDIVTVEASPDNTQWTALWQKSGRHDYFNHEFIDLSSYSGSSIYLRFRLVDQSTHVELTDPGWTLDNIAIITGTSTSVSDPNSVPGPMAVMHPNYPNPFNPSTTISFSLGTGSNVEISVFNIRGQKVRSLYSAFTPAGEHSLVWDGKDDAGRELASGLFFCRLTSPACSKTLKMVMMK
jgi:hypothetical protein